MNKIDVSLNNSEYFKLAIGKRITKKQLHEKNHGTIPVISASRFARFSLGIEIYESEEWNHHHDSQDDDEP